MSERDRSYLEVPNVDTSAFADGEKRRECYPSAPQRARDRVEYFERRNEQMGAAASRYFTAKHKRAKKSNDD
jgi:hypothetical protein